MKFLANHRKEVLQYIAKSGLNESGFSYVKRKGRINIVHDSSKKYFAYLRKKETSINDETHQWEDITYYKVQYNDQPEVIILYFIVSYIKWLKQIED